MRPARDSSKPDPESAVVFALLTALIALGQISTSVYIPSMPSLVEVFVTTSARVNLTLSFFLFGFAVCQLVYGPLSDRFGRRPVLLVGVTLYTAASIACVFAPSIEALIVGRLVQGMTACSGPVLGRAIIRDVYGAERSARALAYVGVTLAVSPAAAPIVGGYLQEWFGWRAAFVLLSAIGGVIVAAVWRLLAETNRRRDARALDLGGFGAAYRRLLTSPAYYGYTLAVAFVFAGLMAYAAGAAFVFIDVIGLSPARFGMVSTVAVAGFLAGSLAAGRLGGRVDLDRLLMAGVSLSFLGGAVMVAIGAAGHVSAPAIILPAMVFTTGMGIVLPTGMAGAMAPFPAIAGAASAVLGFVQMAVSGLASLAVGAFAPTSQVPMAAVIAVVTGIAFGAFTVLVWRRRADREAAPGGPLPSARNEG